MSETIIIREGSPVVIVSQGQQGLPGPAAVAFALVGPPSGTTAQALVVGDTLTLAQAGGTTISGGASNTITIDSPALASTTPADLGTAAVGVGTTSARADHVHTMPDASDVGADPAGTGAAQAAAAIVAHVAETDPHSQYTTAAEAAAAAPVQSVNASTGAVVVPGFQTIATPAGTSPVADQASDTLTLAASGGVTITGNATTDTVTIDAPALASTAPEALAASAAVGVGTTSARTDHQHPYPTAGQIGADPAGAGASEASAAVSAHVGQADPHTQYLKEADAATTYQPLDTDLTALAGLTANGLGVRTGAGTWALRSIAAGDGMTVANGDGVGGNPTPAVDATVVRTSGDQTIGGNKTISGLLRASRPAQAGGSEAFVWTEADDASSFGSLRNYTGTAGAFTAAEWGRGAFSTEFCHAWVAQTGSGVDTGALPAGIFQAVTAAGGALVNRPPFAWFNGGTKQAEFSVGGRFSLPQAGGGLAVKAGTNGRIGVAALVGGTVTVANTTITANSRIILTRQAAGGTTGELTYTRNAGVGCTINSANVLDTSTVEYFIVESIP